jgi:hypothetical protein
MNSPMLEKLLTISRNLQASRLPDDERHALARRLMEHALLDFRKQLQAEGASDVLIVAAELELIPELMRLHDASQKS